MVLRSAAFCVLALVYVGSAIATDRLREVPSEFRHNRIFVTANAPDGSSLILFTDTGGDGTRFGALSRKNSD